MNIFLIETGIEIVMITTRNKISTSGETVTLEDIKRTNSFYPSPDHLYLAKVVTEKKRRNCRYFYTKFKIYGTLKDRGMFLNIFQSIK